MDFKHGNVQPVMVTRQVLKCQLWLSHLQCGAFCLPKWAEGRKLAATDGLNFSHHCSYDTLRKHAADLAGCIDLLVCDEGHRHGCPSAGAAMLPRAALGCTGLQSWGEQS